MNDQHLNYFVLYIVILLTTRNERLVSAHRCAYIVSNCFCFSAWLYIKFLLVWAVVLTADFMLDFRFEFLWPIWMLIRSTFDSIRYQGYVSILNAIDIGHYIDISYYHYNLIKVYLILLYRLTKYFTDCAVIFSKFSWSNAVCEAYTVNLHPFPLRYRYCVYLFLFRHSLSSSFVYL